MPDNKSDEYDVNAMIGVGLCVNVPVKRIVRLNSHHCNPGAIKVEFYSLQDKINVLRAKHRLKYTNEYNEIVLENHKSRTEMLLEQNMNNLLRCLPVGRKYEISISYEEKSIRIGPAKTSTSLTK